MKAASRVGFSSVVICIICLFFPSATEGVIRVVAYNTYNNPDNATEDTAFSNIFSAIGNESVNALAKRLDLLIVSETDTDSSVRLAHILNILYSTDTYAVITSSSSASAGWDRTGVVYDSSTVTLLDYSDLTTIGTHPIVRAHFRPVDCTGPSSEFYVYAIHLKSGDSASDRDERAAEAINLRNDADALGQGVHIIFAGDFNMQSSSEDAWANMLANGNAQAFDVADSPGDWRDNAAFIALHTQDPGSAMDDRFDLQFVTDEFLDGIGLDYIPDSFHVLGNNGTHTLNQPISTGVGASVSVLADLESGSDHLPIIADYYTCNDRPDDSTSVSTYGSIAYNSTALCAMVLANGQYMFTCGDDLGLYDLIVPLDENGQITLYGFCSGFSPFKAILTPAQAQNYDIYMTRAAAGSREIEIDMETEPGITNLDYVRVSGTVLYDGTPLCTMILANGQNMFSCGANLGTFDLEVPLDENGEITFYAFCSGFAPYKAVFSP